MEHYKYADPKGRAPEELDQILDDYFSSMKVSDLIEKWKLGCKPAEIRQILPTVFAGQKCPNCGAEMVKEFHSKGLVKRDGLFGDPFCPECGHREGSCCNCPHCEKLRKEAAARQEEMRQEAERKRDAEIAEWVSSTKLHADFSALGFPDQIFLLCLSEYLKRRESRGFTFYGSCGDPFLPPFTMEGDFISHLWKTGSLSLCDEQDKKDAFDPNPKTGRLELNLLYGNYFINAEVPSLHSFMAATVLDESWLAGNSEFLVKAWKFIAACEVLQYFGFQAKLITTDREVKQELKQAVWAGLGFYSTAQMCSLIYGRASTLFNYFEHNPHYYKEQMFHMFENKTIKQILERVAEKHVYKPARRERSLTQCFLSRFFYNEILGIGDNGFVLLPSEANLVKKDPSLAPLSENEDPFWVLHKVCGVNDL